ncbi:STIP1y and U box-containing protein-like protein [Emericellopsis cladophorae]|uniref:STIP1y and U box-containing protein-like protein n=1 Tax=Emericellopsis cladophorae TaxID=2686198 RepID=A0A9P9XV98_9HYPO|nr:STIP1y and U box-containing protein-like protein [Emericellopsis cladophorae]KAI6778467.1 STIP1y and U box-containing protein-like protein [Emericellopsis cladophorae]
MGDNGARAERLRQDGNEHFRRRNYTAAEACYSQALVNDPNMTAAYANRAMCRFFLASHDASITDCDAVLARDPDHLKAHYYKSKNLLALGNVDEASTHALLAYEMCVAQGADTSLRMTKEHLFVCRKERWDVKERRRRASARAFEREMVGVLEREIERDVLEAAGGSEAERAAVREEGNKRLADLRDVFERARAKDDVKREVPEWLIDDITYNVMLDPVITPSGRSYERESITKFIEKAGTDPTTREPLAKSDLKPNRVLKEACSWFLDENGWAYDW